MRILILGGTGMLGHRLWIELSKKHNVAATIRNESPFENLKSYKLPEVSDYLKLEEIFKDFKPEVVINCIGIIKQTSESNNAILNIEINAKLPNELSVICENHSCRMIHFSTDCVFSGKQGNYLDDDFADANDVYGRTKKLGEVEGKRHVLNLRTSIVGRELRGKLSVVDWFLSQKNEVKGFTKAIFSGFPTKYIAEILELYILPNSELFGTYNLSSEPISKFDLLSLIKEFRKLDIKINSSEDVDINRSLDSTKFKEITRFHPKLWPELVKDIFVDDIKY